jgi:hypothetical protein
VVDRERQVEDHLVHRSERGVRVEDGGDRRRAGRRRSGVGDTASHLAAPDAFETYDTFRAPGNASYQVERSDTGSTTALTVDGPWWTSRLGAFLWDQLRLSTATH